MIVKHLFIFLQSFTLGKNFSAQNIFYRWPIITIYLQTFIYNIIEFFDYFELLLIIGILLIVEKFNIKSYAFERLLSLDKRLNIYVILYLLWL